jgi:hypothetical protein
VGDRYGLRSTVYDLRSALIGLTEEDLPPNIGLAKGRFDLVKGGSIF